MVVIVWAVSAVVASAAVERTGTRADAAIAKAGLVKKSDFPAGWDETPASTSSATPDFGTARSCARLQAAVDKTARLQRATARSSQFRQDDSVGLGDGVTVYRRGADAGAALGVWKRSDVGACLTKAAAAAVTKRPGGTYSWSLGEFSVPPVGDDSTGYQLVETASSRQGQSGTVTVDTQVVRVGRAELIFYFIGDASAALDNQAVVQNAVNRVRTAEASA
jgi:hypothetical protein